MEFKTKFNLGKLFLFVWFIVFLVDEYIHRDEPIKLIASALCALVFLKVYKLLGSNK